jgi:hypothetical protein
MLWHGKDWHGDVLCAPLNNGYAMETMHPSMQNTNASVLTLQKKCIHGLTRESWGQDFTGYIL